MYKFPEGSHVGLLDCKNERGLAYSDLGFQEAFDFAMTLGYSHWLRNWITPKGVYVIEVCK